MSRGCTIVRESVVLSTKIKKYLTDLLTELKIINNHYLISRAILCDMKSYILYFY